MRAILFRTVFLFLITRMFLAPIALRPDATVETPSPVLVFRICTWQQPQHRLTLDELVQAKDATPSHSHDALNYPPSVGAFQTRPSRTFPPHLPIDHYLQRSLGQPRC